ncbi:MAG: hypothetical protein U0929_08840 [Planctomycetaceae bacterium]
MLTAEPHCKYIVWPSWANDFSFGWADMPRLLGDPLSSGMLDRNSLESIRRGELLCDPGPLKFWDGVFGNGIIQYFPAPTRRWIGESMLWREASLSLPVGIMYQYRPAGVASISYIHQRNDVRLRFMGSGKPLPKEYPCGTQIDHVESAGRDIYWVIEHTRAKKRPAGLELIPQMALAFGYEIEPNVAPSQGVIDETSKWLDQTLSYQWFQVRKGPSLAGFQWASLYYCALHIRMTAGSRVKNAHLFAQIEGEPRSIAQKLARGELKRFDDKR